MNAGFVPVLAPGMVRGNPDYGYGDYLRSWVLAPLDASKGSSGSQTFTTSPTVPTSTTAEKQNASANDQVMDSCSSPSHQAQDRTILSSEPAQVLLNLLPVTRKIFGYLPITSLQSCLSVCETFNHVAAKEIATRSRPFILARKMPNISQAQDLLGQMIVGHYDHFLCKPRILIFFKTRLLHPRDYRGDAFQRLETILSAPPAQARLLFASGSKDLTHSDVVVGENIFHSFPHGAHTGCSFAAMQVPEIPGLAVRNLVQLNPDHALRIGHFRWLQHCMDDIAPSQVPQIGRPGHLLFTNCTTLGVPDVQRFDYPFCALKEDDKEERDSCYVWCGSTTQTASIYLDDQLHKGKTDRISAEFEKINPKRLQTNAATVFGFYFTTAPSLLNYSKEELAVLRQFFPTIQLIGCTLSDSLFGNTASTVCETSAEDRVVKVSHATGRSSASVFFLVVVAATK